MNICFRAALLAVWFHPVAVCMHHCYAMPNHPITLVCAVIFLYIVRTRKCFFVH